MAVAFVVWALREKDMERSAFFICVLYALVTTGFLGALMWGFFSSHTQYRESWEAPKYKLLELEE